jgi:4-amino-4-deoxy-L-arabinose transferase-like glycosyltransferase
MTLGMLWLHRFNKDEIEHTHSAWYIVNGARPYADFFQHHHPLLWYLIAPIVWAAGESPRVILMLRLAMLPFWAGTAWLTWRITMEVTGSPQIARVALLFLVSAVAFAASAIEVRPDVPQVFFAVLATCWLLRLLTTRRLAYAVGAGVSLSVSFLFLQ